MAAQVEVQPGEVGRTVVGPRLHLSPLTDSSNSLMEIPSAMSPTHILSPEPNKPAPGPKPRLTPKPFSAERNTTIKPILAPKPHPRPRPESIRLSGYKPEPSSPRAQDPSPVWGLSPLSRATAASFKTFNKLASGQTTKPVAHPFKPAPPLDPEDPGIPSPSERQKPLGSSLAYSRSFKKPPSAEWSGSTMKDDEKDQVTPGRAGPSITRAKSMGFLVQVGQEDQEKDIPKPEETVPLRSPRESKPRPVSAIYLDSPALADAPFPDPRFGKRRPLSADLTSKFESIGLSLHRRTPKMSPKELPAPEEGGSTAPSIETLAKPAVPDRTTRGSIKARISLLQDSSSSPGPDPQSPVLSPEAELPVGVKQLIRQLTEDTTPTHRPPLKPRPQPLDLSKRFYSERSPDLGSEATDRHDIISKDAPRRIESSPSFSPSDQRVFVDLKDPQEKKASRDEVQTVRASVFENVVERCSVRMVDDVKPASPKTKTSLRSSSFKIGSNEDEGTVVTATFREPASPSSPLRVLHAFDTVQAVEETRAVSENVQPAQREDKATTLRRPRSERRRTTPTEKTPDLVPMAAEQQPSPRYLRVGALQKWTTKGLEQEDKGTTKDSTTKRPKTTEEQPKPKATYFALTGQMQEPPPSPSRDKDVSVKTSPLKRNPSLDNSSGKSSQDEAEDEVMKRREQKKLKALEREKLRQLEVERAALSGFHKRKEREEEEQQERERRKREEERRQQEEEERRKREEERLDRERQLLDIQKERQRLEELRRSKEQETQQLQELQLQRLKEEKEKEEREEAERMRQVALDQEVIRMRELEKEREQRKKEEMERKRKEEQERLRKEEMERKRKEEKERKRKEEQERVRKEEMELERQKLQEEAEKMRQAAMEQEILRMRELEKERERQKKEEQERVRREEMERKRKEEMERVRREEMERVRKEEMEREEAEKMRQAAMEQEILRMRELEKERERQKKEEQERVRREEMERKMQEEMERRRIEEMERKRREEQERLRREEMERKRKEEQERVRREEMERKRKEEQERVRKEEMERKRKEEQERVRREEMERKRKEEQERVRREEMEREEAEKMRQVAMEQEILRMRELEKERERQRKEEQERVRREEMERKMKEEMERRRREEMERKMKEEMERRRIEEMERKRREEQERVRREEMERKMKEEMERRRIEEMERKRREEMERKMKEEQERVRKEEMERKRREEQERVRREEMERKRREEQERVRREEMERKMKEEMERRRREELEKQRLRQQQELEKEEQRREELERQKLREEAEKLRQAALEQEILRMRELEKQRQQQLDLEQQELEKQRQRREELERRRLREEAEKLRQAAKQQEAERQRLRRKEEQEVAPLRPRVVDLDSVIRTDPVLKASPQLGDPATRWKEPSPRPSILDLDPLAAPHAPGAKTPPAGEREISWKVPTTSPTWTLSPQDPWELNPMEMSVDAPISEPRKTSTRPSVEQILLRQEERVLSPQASWSSLLDEPLIPLGPSPMAQTRPGGAAESISTTATEPVWFLRDPQEPKAEDRSHRRSEGSQELNRIRSRSVSRRSAPSGSAVEASLNRMRSRSTHREHERHSVVPQKPSAADDEDKWKDSGETPGRETDSQYGTWETGLRTDDSLTPVSPSSESNFSPSPRKPSPPQTLRSSSLLDGDAVDSFLSQAPSFPDAPTVLLDNSALRSRAQLGKRRAPRTRPTRAARHSTAPVGGASEDWIYRDSTELKPQTKDEDSGDEDSSRVDSGSAAAQRIALFPGIDPSALKAHLKKRGDSDLQLDGSAPSHVSRPPKSPFLPRAARVLPPAGGRENGEEASPQWLKELKSKKRLSQYDNES